MDAPSDFPLTRPSVLAHSPLQQEPSPSLDAFDSSFPGESSNSRRQRISMACQYCRHRKIRCCGGAPCRNCARSQRECEYAPVPEETNRATREKKAVAKATKVSTPSSTYSPFFPDAITFDVPYISGAPLRPAHLGHRRSVSTPNFVAPWHSPPDAPTFHSPAMLENPQWMFGGWGAAPAAPVTDSPAQCFPSVLDQTPAHQAYVDAHVHMYQHTPPDSRSNSAESDNQTLPTSWSTPNIPSSGYLRPHIPLTPLVTRSPHMAMGPYRSSPETPGGPYFTPFPTPPIYQHHQMIPQLYSPSPLSQAHNTSPTLAPEPGHKELIGLGIGVQSEPDIFQAPILTSDEYFARTYL